METIDKNRIRLHFRRGLDTYDNAAAIQRVMAEGLLAMLKDRCGERTAFSRVLELGCGTGIFTKRFAQDYTWNELFLNDLVPECARLTALLPGARFLQGDAEEIVFPGDLDLIAANAVVQWFGELAPFLRRSAKALNRGGLLLFSAFGQKNLAEVRAVSGRGLAGSTVESLTSELAAAGFETVSTSEDCCKLRFPSPDAVLRHLKETGANGIGSPLRWTRGRIADFSQRYRVQFGCPDGSVELTYHPILLLAVKKQDTQK